MDTKQHGATSLWVWSFTWIDSEEYSNSLLYLFCTHCSALPRRKKQLSFQTNEWSRTGRGDKCWEESWGHLIPSDTELPLPQIIRARRRTVGDRFLWKTCKASIMSCKCQSQNGERMRPDFPLLYTALLLKLWQPTGEYFPKSKSD